MFAGLDLRRFPLRARSWARAVFIVLAVLLAAPAPAPAEEHFDDASFEVSRWTTRDGLPSNVVRALALTPDGFLWIGTWGGLARFDGVRFETFDLTSTPELGGVDINALAVDAKGSLWIATHRGGLCTYRDGRFQVIRPTPIGERGESLRAMLATPDGSVWVGGRRLRRFVGTRVLDDLPIGVWGLQTDGAGDLWVANWHGAHRIRGGKILASDSTAKFARGITKGGGGTLFAHGKRVIVRYPTGEVVARHPPLRVRPWHVWGSTVDHAGDLWWAVDSGLYHVSARDAAEPRLDWERLSPVVPFAITGRARAVIEIDDRTFFVASDAEGLIRLRRRMDRRLAIPHLRRGLAPLSDGSIWVAPRGRSRIVRLKGDEILEEHAGFPKAHVSLARDGGVWVAYADGYARVKDGATERFAPPEGRQPPIRPIYEDRSGRIWWIDGDGAACIEGGAVTATLPGPIWGERDDGGLLVARAAGLGTWGWVTAEGTELHASLEHMPPVWQALCNDSDDRVWVAHAGSGLSCFHEGGLAVLTTEHGLPSNLLADIVEDSERRLWINSNKGMFVAALDDLVAVVEGRRDRVSCQVVWTREMNYLGSAIGADGALYASTVDGYLTIDTRRVRPHTAPPTVRIDSLFAQGRRLALGPSVELPLGARSFRVHFIAPMPSGVGRLRYRHRVEGLESNWTMPSGQRSAAYHGLSPGRFVFQVQTSQAGGAWSEAARVEILVPARVHETPWFRVIAAVLLLGTGLWIYATVARSRRRKTRALAAERERDVAGRAARRLGRRLTSAQEDERRRIALELHDDINQRLAVLALRLETQPEDAADHQRLAQQLSTDVHRIAYALHPSRLEERGVSSALRALTREVRNHTDTAIELSVAEGSDDVSSETALCLYRLTQEALHNIRQHSQAREVAVWTRIEGPDVLLGIEDDGVGFDSEAVSGTGLGLTGMSERAHALGGTVKIESAPGKGTRLLARLPRRRVDP